MASHLICGQTNCYITVSQPVVNQVTNDLYVTLVAAFDPPTYHDTTIIIKLSIYMVQITHNLKWYVCAHANSSHKTRIASNHVFTHGLSAKHVGEIKCYKHAYVYIVFVMK